MDKADATQLNWVAEGCAVVSERDNNRLDETRSFKVLSPGAKISRYKIIEKIGEGGMGLVYKAQDTRLERTIALKFLPPVLTRDKEAKRRFIQEAKASAALNDPQICTIHEIDEAEGQTFIAMEYIEGQSLKETLSSGPLSIDEAVDMILQVAKGLEKAHKKGIVHRDIKPANIMITDEGQAKITDFGLAKLSWGVDLTKTSTIVGTVAYMSPEQARGEEVDLRTDIWSLGAMLYEMLTGERPFQKSQEYALIYAILNENPAPLTSLRPDIPGHLEQVVEKALAKKVNQRYQMMNQLMQDLKQAKPITLPKGEKSIAVLPFTNMSVDPEQEYFCDGVAEELINALTQIRDLRVVARTSAFSFKGKDVDIREIGRKLNVDNVLEGSVRKAGNRLRITAQLINVSNGYHLWSERYDREMEDVFAIQDEVTLAIVDKLKVNLLGKEKAIVLKRHTEDPEAYSLYLKGRYFWNKLNPGGFEKAREYFEKAIEKDPNLAVAYAGLADSYWMSSFWGNLPPRQTYPKAREVANKAIEIDDTLGEAHATLASIHTHYDWDWEAAEREFKRAIELAPGSSYTRVYYSFYLNLQRRHDEAIAQARKAKELDPLSSFSGPHLGHRLWQARRYDEAIEEFKKWLEFEPNDWFTHHHLGEIYLGKSMIKEAIASINKSVELSGGVPLNIASAAVIHYRIGDREVAERLFNSLKERAEHEYIPPMCFISIHMARGEMDRAFEWVKRAYEERDSFLPWLRVTPMDRMGLLSDPRIDELLDRLGLP